MSNYFKKMEKKDAKNLKNFNEKVKWFNELEYNEEFARIDAMAKDKKGRKTHIEVKQRTKKYSDFTAFTKAFDTIYLDTGKLETLSQIMLSGHALDEQELFISIFNDGNVIVVHNLNKKQPMMWLPNQRVWNEGKKKFEYEHRVGLYWWEGMIYEKQPNGEYRRWTDDEIRWHKIMTQSSKKEDEMQEENHLDLQREIINILEE